ncbi:hypothetical protein DFH28DRAFT_912906, partial [Melampsora americana]
MLAEFAKKKAARSATPGLDVHDGSKTTPDTPRSERIARMIPGNEGDRSLTTLLTKLVSVANSAIQLPARGRLPSKIQVDVDSCADILVLINAAYDKHQIEKTKKALFHEPASSHEGPTRAAASLIPSALGSNAAHDSQIVSLGEKFDVLNEKVSFLISSLPNLSCPVSQKPAKTPDHSSYAAKAAKARNASAKPATRPNAAPPAKKRQTNTVTLVQVDKTQNALKELTTTQLIQGFNNAFGLNNLKVKESDAMTI